MTITLYWLIFIAIFLIVFFIDLYVTDHRKGTLTVKTALKWTGLWISIAMLFAVSLYFFFPQNPDSETKTSSVMMIKFIAGYLTEYSLSIDNLFVFIMIFSLMGVSENNQPRLLKLGILISIVLRILFIVAGMGLVQQFEWIIYVFGAILLYTAYKMAFSGGDDNVDPTSNILYKGASKLFPIDPDHNSSHFIHKIDGKWYITNILLVLLVIGSTDVLFAVDSIPAIIGVIAEGSVNVLSHEEENFLAITSNVFAVMGLVSLFFALKGIMGMFRYLKTGVSFILFFIGAKMLLGAIPAVGRFFSSYSWISLAVIVGTLTLSVLLSIAISEDKEIKNLKEENEQLKSKRFLRRKNKEQ